MNLPSPFDEFVFTDRIAKKLRVFIEDPSTLPQVVCFHGYPGVGKTSFARAFADHFAASVQYLPMNESKMDAGFERNLAMSRTSVSLGRCLQRESKKRFEWVTILDEFHNLTPKSQDYFKTKFDASRPEDRVIVCLNTSNGKPLERYVTEPIASRMYCIDFNVRRSETPDLVDGLLDRFPNLERFEIFDMLPDMRKLVRENELRARGL